MHFYSHSYEETLSLPINTFWFMNNCIDRIEAKGDMRKLATAVAAQGGEGASEHHKRLVIEVGTVVKGRAAISVERDQAGFDELKALAEL